MLRITNLRESVCPDLFHRQFVLCVNTIFIFCIGKDSASRAKCQISTRESSGEVTFPSLSADMGINIEAQMSTGILEQAQALPFPSDGELRFQTKCGEKFQFDILCASLITPPPYGHPRLRRAGRCTPLTQHSLAFSQPSEGFVRYKQRGSL